MNSHHPIARRVTIADGMVLIAATTVGLAMARSYMQSLYHQIPAASSLRTYLLFQGISPCLVFTAMVALIPLRLRRPRPRLGALVRQPGFAACCAGVAALALGVLTTLATRHRSGYGDTAYYFWASSASWGDSIVPGPWLAPHLDRTLAHQGRLDRPAGPGTGRVLDSLLANLVFAKWLNQWLPAL